MAPGPKVWALLLLAGHARATALTAMMTGRTCYYADVDGVGEKVGTSRSIYSYSYRLMRRTGETCGGQQRHEPVPCSVWLLEGLWYYPKLIRLARYAQISDGATVQQGQAVMIILGLRRLSRVPERSHSPSLELTRRLLFCRPVRRKL